MEKEKTGKRYQGMSVLCWHIEGVLSNRKAGEGLPEKMTFEQISKECKRALGQKHSGKRK